LWRVDPMNIQRRFRPALTCLSLLSMTACLACLWWLGRPAPENAAITADEPEGILCVGHVDVESRVAQLAALRPGRVAAVLVGANQVVEKGTVLIQLEDAADRHRLAQAEAALDEACQKVEAAERLPEQHRARVAQQEAAVEAAFARLAATRLQADRLDRLRRNKLGSDEEAEAAALQVKALAAAARAEKDRLHELLQVEPELEVARARAAVAAAQAQRDLALDALRECRIVAPGPGMVLSVFASPGDVVGPQTGVPLVQFCPSGPRILRAEVDQEFASQVAVGQLVLLLEEQDGRVCGRGKVVLVSSWCSRRRVTLQDPRQANDARTLECLIQPATEQPLRIGQEVRLKILTGQVREEAE
jgi:multidrug resistance efflux pump